jgi:hypothetical protein
MNTHSAETWWIKGGGCVCLLSESGRIDGQDARNKVHDVLECEV